MPGYKFDAYVVRVIDGDSVVVDPQIYKQDEVLRVRLKDVFAPEPGEEGASEALAAARAMFPETSRVTITNTAVKWSFNRLVARLDPA